MKAAISLPDESSLSRAAADWVNTVETPALVYLSGDLGAGKTTFVRAALTELGFSGTVKSPTFSLLESYSVNDMSIHHMDLYRMEDPEELEFIGFRDLIGNADFIFIEWPDRASGYLPAPTHLVHLDYLTIGRSLILS